MLDRWAEFFLLHPGRLVATGKALSSGASALVMFGACANMYAVAANAITSSHQARSSLMLADLLPDLPTWWVPETLPGFAFVIAIGIAGVVVANAGRTIERLARF